MHRVGQGGSRLFLMTERSQARVYMVTRCRSFSRVGFWCGLDVVDLRVVEVRRHRITIFQKKMSWYRGSSILVLKLHTSYVR